MLLTSYFLGEVQVVLGVEIVVIVVTIVLIVWRSSRGEPRKEKGAPLNRYHVALLVRRFCAKETGHSESKVAKERCIVRPLLQRIRHVLLLLDACYNIVRYRGSTFRPFF